MKKLLIAIVLLVSANAQAALHIQSWTLDNGARVLFVENHSIPILDLSVEFDAGSRRDPAGKSGVASLANAMLARGVHASKSPVVEPALNEAQISDAFADVAAERGGGAGSDRAGVTLRTLSNHAERDSAISMLARVLAQPSFPEELLVRDKARLVAAIREDDTKPESIGSKAIWHLMYGSHPYAQQPTVDSIDAITRDDLVAFYRDHYVANHAVIAMIGDISREEADTVAKQLTLRLPQGASLSSLPQVPPAKAAEEDIAHPASQAHILIGMPSLARGDADFFPLTVGNYVLGGGGFVSRLTTEVREKRGLSYSVYSYFSPLAQTGPFQIGLQTKKEQAGQALKVVHDTLAAFLRDGPTPQELQAAKDNLIGGFALRIDNNRKILDNIAIIGFYNLPLDYLDTWTTKIANVTAAEIKAAFNRKVSADKLDTVVVGNGK